MQAFRFSFDLQTVPQILLTSMIWLDSSVRIDREVQYLGMIK